MKRYIPMFVVAFGIFLTFAACAKTGQNALLPGVEEKPKALNYLALGDSYTIGESVLEAERWPNILVAELRKLGLDINNPRIVARTGWTTDELMAELNRQQIKDTFDLVSLLIGVNNQYRGRSAEQFRGELVQLIRKAINYAGGDTNRVFLVSIPDWGVTPFAMGRDRERIAREIDQFNSVVQQEALTHNILFINITDISRLARNDLSLLATDRLHPSGKMYRMWVERMLPLIFHRLNANE